MGGGNALQQSPAVGDEINPSRNRRDTRRARDGRTEFNKTHHTPVGRLLFFTARTPRFVSASARLTFEHPFRLPRAARHSSGSALRAKGWPLCRTGRGVFSPTTLPRRVYRVVSENRNRILRRLPYGTVFGDVTANGVQTISRIYHRARDFDSGVRR